MQSGYLRCDRLSDNGSNFVAQIHWPLVDQLRGTSLLSEDTAPPTATRPVLQRDTILDQIETTLPSWR